MKIVHVQKNKLVERKFEGLKQGSFFLHPKGGLNLKIQDKAFNLTTRVVSSSDPEELVGLVEVEIRYSEICGLQDEEAEMPTTENLRLAACKRALTELREIDYAEICTIPEGLIDMLEEAVGPEWLKRNPGPKET